MVSIRTLDLTPSILIRFFIARRVGSRSVEDCVLRPIKPSRHQHYWIIRHPQAHNQRESRILDSPHTKSDGSDLGRLLVSPWIRIFRSRDLLIGRHSRVPRFSPQKQPKLFLVGSPGLAPMSRLDDLCRHFSISREYSRWWSRNAANRDNVPLRPDLRLSFTDCQASPMVSHHSRRGAPNRHYAGMHILHRLQCWRRLPIT